MTDKQKHTLVLYAQDYSIYQIAKKEKCSTSAIIDRLRRIAKIYPEYYTNTLSLRECYKQQKYNVQHTVSFDGADSALLPNNDGFWDNIKEKF